MGIVRHGRDSRKEKKSSFADEVCHGCCWSAFR
jgi:hypothetical protein